jgi:hypothetical protein
LTDYRARAARIETVTSKQILAVGDVSVWIVISICIGNYNCIIHSDCTDHSVMLYVWTGIVLTVNPCFDNSVARRF